MLIPDKPTLTVKEVSHLTGLSDHTIRSYFLKEPGVIILGTPRNVDKRRYRTIRIPRYVYERVLQKWSTRGRAQ